MTMYRDARTKFVVRYTRDMQGARKIPSVVKDPFNILKYMNHTPIFASREAGSISYGTIISFHSCQSLRDQSKGNVLLLFFVILIVGFTESAYLAVASEKGKNGYISGLLRTFIICSLLYKHRLHQPVLLTDPCLSSEGACLILRQLLRSARFTPDFSSDSSATIQ